MPQTEWSVVSLLQRPPIKWICWEVASRADSSSHLSSSVDANAIQISDFIMVVITIQDILDDFEESSIIFKRRFRNGINIKWNIIESVYCYFDYAIWRSNAKSLCSILPKVYHQEGEEDQQLGWLDLQMVALDHHNFKGMELISIRTAEWTQQRHYQMWI